MIQEMVEDNYHEEGPNIISEDYNEEVKYKYSMII